MTLALIALPAVLTDPKQAAGWNKVTPLLLSDLLLIIGVGLGLMVILVLAVYLWKKRLHKRRRHISSGEKVYRGTNDDSGDSHHEPEAVDADDDNDEDEHKSHSPSSSRRRYKYRARRRTHRSRNPTLSETGGLPPVKPQESGKPF